MGIEIVYGIGVVLLAAALAWGAMRYRQRTRLQKRLGDDATSRLYRKDER